jgi:hypothetical protein
MRAGIRLVDYAAVPLLGCLRGRSEQFPDTCPRDAGMASGNYGIDDLAFAARSSQSGPLQQVLLNWALIILGGLVFLELASKLVCMIQNLLNRTGHHFTS